MVTQVDENDTAVIPSGINPTTNFHTLAFKGFGYLLAVMAAHINVLCSDYSWFKKTARIVFAMRA
jgi:hypothetical protein